MGILLSLLSIAYIHHAMKNWITLTFMLLSLQGQAQLVFGSLQEVLKYADGHAISIQSASIGEEIALAGKKDAKSLLLPSVHATAGYNDNLTLQPTLVPAAFFNPAAPEGQFEELTFGRKYLYSVGVQAQWDILNFQKVFASQTASIQAKSSKIQTEKTRYDTYHQLASTYYSIILTQESIRIYEENVQTSTAILASAREKYQEGLLTEAELNQAEIKHLQNQTNLSAAESSLEQFYVQFQSQLNTAQEIQIADLPENFVLNGLEILTTHPHVRLQQAEVEKQAATLKQKKSMHLPSLSLYYQYNFSWATDNFANFSDANELPQQIFGVQMNIPLFNGFSTRQQVNASEKELALQQLKLENAQLVSQKEDEMLQLQLKQASEQLTKNKRILSLQEKNDVHAMQTYEGGLMSLDQRLTRYDELLATQNMYLQSLASYTLAQYNLYIRQLNFQSPERS
jgi:outer membrane protein